MYLSVKETAELLAISEIKVKNLILQNQIRAIFDGTDYLINKEQFNTHFKQVEKYKKLVEEVWNEPIPEDLDIKDED
ncbi:excisionase family DNA-binding protein [Niallia sp. FSL W8-0635]|uniref:excisionase family DNA-binding protein n=1 Tax=Niallia sp. FSL W8-0635 TaxID=2975337 RepID=UPI0009CA57C1|nr:DNA binding domain, excisionase family [Mycobacteroides abscessus subsp. abscessus]HEO8419527.1 excisionase family DNA-binding protein [Yersinia enterocolitica]